MSDDNERRCEIAVELAKRDAAELMDKPVIIGALDDRAALAALAVLGPPPPFRIGAGEVNASLDTRIDWVIQVQDFCTAYYGEMRQEFAIEYDKWWAGKLNSDVTQVCNKGESK